MPQNHTPGAPSKARLQAGVGYVPQQPISPTSEIEFNGSTGDLDPTDATAEQIAGTMVTFGTGAPAGSPDFEGQFYFDDTGPYVGYIGRGGAWHQF